MIQLHQQKSEIDAMDSFFLRGLYEIYMERNGKKTNKGIDGENTGDIDPSDYDTSMWFN